MKSPINSQWLTLPQIRKVDGAQVRDPGDHREHGRVGQPEEDGADQKAQETGDQVVEVALAATGGTGARSEAGAGHADAENQATHQVADDVGGHACRRAVTSPRSFRK